MKKLIDNTQRKPYNNTITISNNKPMIENSRFGLGIYREPQAVRSGKDNRIEWTYEGREKGRD